MNHSIHAVNCVESLENRLLLSLAELDHSFSGDGMQTYPFLGSQVTSASAVNVQRDGKVVIAGVTTGRDHLTQLLLARVNADGSVDRSFGQNGRVITHFPSSDLYANVVAMAETLRITSDGKILVGGSLGGNLAVFRFNRDGSPDKSFSRDGVQTLKNVRGRVKDIELLPHVQPRGEILVGGWTDGNAGDPRGQDFVLFELNSNGSVDRSFGARGIIHNDLGSDDRLFQVAVDGASGILAAGIAKTAKGDTIVLSRFGSSGALDRSFGNGGNLITALDGTDVTVSSLTILSNGQILLSGGDNGDAFVMRLNSRGGLDSSFGQAGIRRFDAGSFEDTAQILRASSRGIVALAVSHPQDGSGNPQDTQQSVVHWRGDGSDDPAWASPRMTLGGSAVDLLNGGAVMLADNRLLALFSSQPSYYESDLILARFGSDGLLDKTFAKQGKITIDDSGPLKVTPLRVVPQNNGKTLILAQTDMYEEPKYMLLRINANGRPDRTFGNGGRLELKKDEFFNLYTALGVDSAGKIIVGGANSNIEMTLQRFNADGSVDSSFGSNGLAHYADRFENPDWIVPLGGGKLLVSGGEYAGMGSSNAVLTRLNADGSIDKTFAGDGTASIDFLDANWIDRLFVAADGKITAVGTSNHYYDLPPVDGGEPNLVFVVRLNANGTFDNSFSGDGKLPLNENFVHDARMLPGGGVSIITGGEKNNFKVLRYKADGSLEKAFTRRAPSFINRAMFEADGTILLLCKTTTLHLAADGSQLSPRQSGGRIADTYGTRGYYSANISLQLTADRKLLVVGDNPKGDLLIRRYLLS